MAVLQQVGQRRWWMSDSRRTSVAAAAGVVGQLTVLNYGEGTTGTIFSLLTFWDIAALVYLALTWTAFVSAGPAEFAEWARVQSRPRPLWVRLVSFGPDHLWIVQAGSLSALIVAGYALPRASELAPQSVFPLLVLGTGVVLSAWFVCHTAYALHYALAYFNPDAGGGLEFPGEEEPRFLDFAYFAYAVGMTFGTTDVTVTARRMRRPVLIHSIFSFLFNTIILALTVTFIMT